ncbi:phage holin [Bacillus sp. JJ722]|uniref:phage holin n=1 Tax=Bacillus sp. JJ722 TaxID=3122973 RepID=UPI002FFE3C2A
MKNITAGTVTRFVLLLIALINTGLNMAGIQMLPINEENIATFINMLFLGGTALWGYWKNNDITKKARESK